METHTDNRTFMHVSLYVNDILQTTTFYTAFFGQQPAKVMPGYAKYELHDPALLISFVENAEKVAPNFGHLGFRVNSEQELNDRLQAVKQAGLPQLIEMGTSCCYAVQDKFWVHDPDGYAWEVYLFKQDAQFNDPRYNKGHVEESAQCCSPAMATVNEPAVVPLVNFKVKSKPVANACAPDSGCC